MENINIKVAFCDKCGGYHSATPADESQKNHPEIIDHYFYHGEPWFTLDSETFDNTNVLDTAQIKIITLERHQKNDYKYCICKDKIDAKLSQENFHLYSDINSKGIFISL